MRWRVTGLGTALASVLMATPPAIAQTSASPQATSPQAAPSPQAAAAKSPTTSATLPGVTVTHPRRKAMNAYIDDIAQPSQHGELAVWTGAICLRVGGIDPAQAKYVKDRILDTAGKLGIGREPGDCQPNMLVVFSDDPGALAREFRKKAWFIFDDVDMVGHVWKPHQDKLEAFYNSTQPVRWWMQAQPFSSDDPGAGPNAGSASIGFSGGGGAPGGGRGAGGVANFAGEVKLYDPMQSMKGLRDGFSFALVIVDAKQAKGLPMEAVGSYVSMVTLARFKSVPEVGDAPSVLSLFADHAAARPYYRDLTKRDWAFLYSLYATGDMGDYNEQRAEMGVKMERIMVGKYPRAVGAESEDAAPDPAP
jgi:hypothetical protein